jgi:uncharacterized protein
MYEESFMRDEANDNIAGRTPLMLAAFRGDIAETRRLLEQHADVNARDKDGDTALMFAAFKGHAEIVSLLLRHGANVHAKAKNGWTAKKAAHSGLHIHIAVMLRRAEMGWAAAAAYN